MFIKERAQQTLCHSTSRLAGGYLAARHQYFLIDELSRHTVISFIKGNVILFYFFMLLLKLNLKLKLMREKQR